MAEVNDSIPTLGLELATISTPGEGLTEACFSPVPGLLMAYTNTLWCLSRCINLNLDNSAVCCSLLMYGRIMGGHPISPGINYFYRGHEDKVTYYLSVYRCQIVGQLHEALKEKILEVTCNLDVRKWFDRAGETEEEAFLSNLSTMRPLYPKLASDIYRVSHFSICLQMVGRFDRTNTI